MNPPSQAIAYSLHLNFSNIAVALIYNSFTTINRTCIVERYERGKIFLPLSQKNLESKC